MSIATNEAEKLPILANIYKKADLDHNVITFKGANDVAEAAYIACRTAEPTRAEIEEVAKEIAKTNFEVANISKKPSITGTYIYDWHFYLTNAKAAIMAARKAVME
jgi:hypothetical protein